MRFVPDGQNGTTGSVTFCAWDQTSGTQGTKVDTTTSGGTTASSTATATSIITVSSVNDAPVLSGANNFATITEDQATNSGDLVSFFFNDTATTEIYALSLHDALPILVSSTGTWQYSTDA